MTKYLIVNADDLGLSEGVSRGIIEAHQHGIVTSTTAMVNMPHAAEAIQHAQKQAPRLGIGLHITLTEGKPLLPPDQVPSLVCAEGRFYTLENFKQRNPNFNTAELRAEIKAQFRRFVDIAGQLPDHLDAHHYAAYLNPDAFDMVLKLAAQYRLPIRSAETYMTLAAMREVFIARGYPPAVVETLPGAILDRYAANDKPRWPDSIERGFYRDGATLENLLRLLKNLPDGTTELMCHPGYIYDLDDNNYRAPREVERRLLMDAAVREAVERYKIRLITFSELPRQTAV